MKIELFTLCEYSSNHDGSLTIVNTLDRIETDKLPWRAYFGFAIKGIILHSQPSDTILTFQISKKDSDKVLFQTTFPIIDKIGRFAASGNLRGFIFEEEGDYLFQVSSNHGLNIDYPFIVVKNEPSN